MKFIAIITLLCAFIRQEVLSWSFQRLPSFVEVGKLNLQQLDARKLLATSLLSLGILSSVDIESVNADVRLNAPTAAGTRVNSDPESLLRFGLPIDNKEIREIQLAVESIKADLKGRRAQFALADVNNVKRLLSQYSNKIVAVAPENHKTKLQEVFSKISSDISPIEKAIQQETASGSGSVQEREFLDEAFLRQDIVAKELTQAEELLVPDTFRRIIPEEYSNLPALQGRAVVEFVIKRADGTPYDVDGKLYDEVKLKMVIDGYNAPLTGGNFVDLVNKGFYKNLKITRSDGFVVQTGDADPSGEVHGYVPPGSKEVRSIPLEISLKDDKELLYGITSEDDGRGASAAVLPFQSYGALGMARSEFEADSASSQFFWLLFESDLTPAGKNLLDGRYACFGYTVEGGDLLKGVKVDDVIVSAKVLSGGEHLEVPK